MARAVGHAKEVHAPSLSMRGVVFAFVAFVALGSGFFIWRDRQAGPTQLDTAVAPVGAAKTPIKQPTKPRATGYKPKSPDKPLIMSVPFVAQAPFGNWADPRQEDGCEEASALMAMRWRDGKPLTASQGLEQILAISKYEEDTYGTYNDTSAQDTVDRIFKGYFKYSGAYVRYSITKDDIIKTLDEGKLVVVPAYGQKLGNPYYTPPGPIHHMLVIKGYDMKTKEFITNDPGTRRGEGYRYDMDVLLAAVTDYATGQHEPLTGMEPSVMIVISKRK